MEVSLAPEVNKNDLSQVRDKFRQEPQNGSNGSNLQNGLLQYAANEIAKGKGIFPVYCLACFVYL